MLYYTVLIRTNIMFFVRTNIMFFVKNIKHVQL